MIAPSQPPTRDDVEAHYDTLDFFYRDTWGEHLHHGFWESGDESPDEAIEHLTRTVADLARLSKCDRVCDIGCGYGGTSWFVAENYGCDVVGYTLSAVQCSVASKRENSSDCPRPDFIHGDWLDNDLPDTSIDAAISIECVSHVEDKAAFFNQIARALVPGGRAVICAWLAAPELRPWHVKRLLKPICREGRLPGLATTDEYRHLIADAGLELIECREIGPAVRKTWSVIFRRLIGKVLTRREYRRFPLDKALRNRRFARTIVRLLLAYRTRCLDYGIFVAERP